MENSLESTVSVIRLKEEFDSSPIKLSKLMIATKRQN